MYPGNKNLRICCVTFSAYLLKGILHHVEIIYEFLSIRFMDYDLYRRFFADYFISVSSCAFNCESSGLLIIVVLIFSTTPFSFLTIVCRHLVGILGEEAAFLKVCTNGES